jgi:PAS domain S-box-containing protein
MGDADRTSMPDHTEMERLQRDVARLKKSETDLRGTVAALQRSEEYFRAITQNASDIIIIVDMKARITYVNPTIERQLGYKPEELIGRSGFDFIALADIPRAVYDFGRSILTREMIIPNAFAVKHKDGSERILEGVGTNLLRDPVVRGFVMNVRDVTERKKAEDELALYRKHLEAVIDERTSELAQTNSQLVIELSERRRMGEALRESEEQYRNLLEEAPIGFCIIDPLGNIQYINRRFEEEAGWTRAELIGKNGFSVGFFDDETGRRLLDRLAARLKGETHHLIEVPVTNKKGKRLWVEVKGTLLKKGGMISGIQLAITDVTERRQAAEALRRSEEKYRNIFENAVEGIYQSTPDGRFITVNPALARMCGYSSPEDMMDGIKDMATEFHANPADWTRFTREIETYGHVEDFEYPVRKKGANTIWVSAKSRCIRDKSDSIIRYEGSIDDISHRKEAEAALRKAEEKYRNIFENAAEGIYQSTADGQYIEANPAFARMLGYDSPEDLKASISNIGDQVYCDPSIREASIRELEKRDVGNFEVRIRRRDGDDTWILNSVRAIRDDNGTIIRFEGVTQDITERKDIERALRESERKYRDLVEMLPQSVFETDGSLRITFANHFAFTATGYTEEDIQKGINLLAIISQKDHQKITNHIKHIPERNRHASGIECTALKKDGSTFLLVAYTNPIIQDGKFAGLRGIFVDITERKQIETALRKRERELKNKSARLMEMNTALKVLIKNRDAEKKEHEEKILTNVKELVLPYINKLKKSRLNTNQSTYIDIVEANLNTIISSFLHNLTSRYLNLTPREIQLAYLIKEGKTTKEMSELLNLSERTIDSHRDRIRKKLGLSNRKVNLKSYLLSLI